MTPTPEQKEYVKTARQHGHVDRVEDFSCYECPDSEKCPFAYDAYNTNGDCLAEK